MFRYFIGTLAQLLEDKPRFLDEGLWSLVGHHEHQEHLQFEVFGIEFIAILAAIQAGILGNISAASAAWYRIKREKDD